MLLLNAGLKKVQEGATSLEEVLSVCMAESDEEEDRSQPVQTYDAQIPVKSLRETERDAIQRALELSQGKRKEAAERLEIPLRTLYEKIKRYGLKG